MDAHFERALPGRQRGSHGHGSGEGHELSIRSVAALWQGGSSSMRTIVPIPHSGQSRRFLPVRAA